MSMLLKKKGEKRSSANGRTTDCEILESSVPLLKVAGDSCPDRNAIPTMTEDSSAQPELTPRQEAQSEISKKVDQETEKNDPSADSVGNQTPDETMNNTDIPADIKMDESSKKAEENPEHDASNSSRKIDDSIELDSKSNGSNADQGYQDKSADQNSNNAQQNPTEGAHSDSESIYCDCKSVVSLDSMQGTSRTVTANETTVMTSEKTDTIPTDDIGNISKSRKNSSGSSICTYALSTQSTMTDFCRICHCEGDAELGPLIAPCFCRGSLRYVHQACLQQWIKSSDSKHCELCGYHFVMDSKLKPFHKWKKLSMSTTERRKIMCSVMFHIIAITCVIWSLYVLIERTANEIKTGKLEWPFWTKLVVVAIGFTGGLVFMYVQCKVYVQLWRRLKAFNRVIYVKNNLPPTVATLNDDTVNDLQSVASVAVNPVSVSSMSEPNQNEEGVVIVQMNCQPN